MVEASSDTILLQRGSRGSGRKAGGEPGVSWRMPPRGSSFASSQQPIQSAVIGRQTPHGVKLVSKAGKGQLTEPKNLTIVSTLERGRMIEATDDHGGEGRSPRSSPRAGKPLTWRRGAAGGEGQQEVGGCPAR